VYLTGTRPAIRRALLSQGVRPPQVRFKMTIASAVAAFGAGPVAAPVEPPIAEAPPLHP
jgi:SulP family sulfate permease